MANNRMWIVCGECEEKVLLAKYWIDFDWRIYHEEQYLEDWFAKHRHTAGAFLGATHFKVEYENTADAVIEIPQTIEINGYLYEYNPDIYCPHCGLKGVWIEVGEGDYYSGPVHHCKSGHNFYLG